MLKLAQVLLVLKKTRFGRRNYFFWLAHVIIFWLAHVS